MAETFLFHRYQSEWIFATGTVDQARAYVEHLNGGRVDNLWSVRRHGGKSRGVNLSTELDRIAKEQTHIVSPRHEGAFDVSGCGPAHLVMEGAGQCPNLSHLA